MSPAVVQQMRDRADALARAGHIEAAPRATPIGAAPKAWKRPHARQPTPPIRTAND